MLDRKGGPCQSISLLNMGSKVESYIMDLEVDGIYRAFDFMKTELVISKTTFPLLTSNLTHLIALEV
jgi:hypothetical protein